MNFIVTQLSLAYYSLGVTISFCKFWFENYTLILARSCHFLDIWCVFIADMLISSFFFFDSAWQDLCWYISKYIRMYFSFINTSDLMRIIFSLSDNESDILKNDVLDDILK